MLTWGWVTDGSAPGGRDTARKSTPQPLLETSVLQPGPQQACGFTAWVQSVQALQNEIDRNCNRIKEIFQYIDDLQEQLDNTQIPDPTE